MPTEDDSQAVADAGHCSDDSSETMQLDLLAQVRDVLTCGCGGAVMRNQYDTLECLACGEPVISCEVCGFTDVLDAFDICGACPGNVFCIRCNTELDIDTGKRGEHCGKCSWCQGFQY